MKRLTSIHISEMTDSQIEELRAKTGLNQSEIVTTAIDRMYREEIEMNEAQALIRNRKWNELEALVWEVCNADDRDGLGDWLQNGSYSGSETIKSLADDWDGVCENAKNL